MQLIETVTVPSGGSTEINFSAISSDYTDLVVKVSADSNALRNLGIEFNGSSTGYTFKVLGNFANSVASYTQTAFGSPGWVMSGYAAVSPIVCSMEAYIPNYASSAYKRVSVDWAHEINSSSQYMGITQGLWSNPAAITSVAVLCLGGSLSENSSASLYGILAGSDGTTTVS